MKKRHEISIGLAAFIFTTLIFLSGCGADPPFMPRTYYGDVKDVVIKEVGVNSVKWVNKPLFGDKSRIAVLGFRSPEDTQGGILVSDIFSLLLQKRGFNVVERDNIDRILNEQELAKSGQTTLTDLEIARRIGKLTAVDYMVFGAVTLYKSEGQTIYLPINIREEDRKIYTEDYNKFRGWYVGKLWPPWVSKERRIKQLRVDLKVLSLNELEDELQKLSKMEFRVIGSLGISAKVVNVKDAKIYWMGQGETVDFTLVNAANRILEGFIDSIQSNR